MFIPSTDLARTLSSAPVRIQLRATPFLATRVARRYPFPVMDVSHLVELNENPAIESFGPGDTVRVSAKVVEGERERTQVFEGVVIRKNKGGAGANFTVRRIAHGVGVERTFNLLSPRLEKVQVVRRGKVRPSLLYYLPPLTP